jgi:hypothetical protein
MKVENAISSLNDVNAIEGGMDKVLIANQHEIAQLFTTADVSS